MTLYRSMEDPPEFCQPVRGLDKIGAVRYSKDMADEELSDLRCLICQKRIPVARLVYLTRNPQAKQAFKRCWNHTCSEACFVKHGKMQKAIRSGALDRAISGAMRLARAEAASNLANMPRPLKPPRAP